MGAATEARSMTDFGPVDRAFFEGAGAPSLGADRDDVLFGPAPGVDFGAVRVADSVVAMATDPVVLVPSLGLERAAWFAVHALLADVAVSGIPPAHLSIDLNLPPATTDEAFATVWETVDREATDLGVSITTGHTGRYAGCQYPTVGGGTAIAVGDPDDLVRPDGARVGDRVLVTKGPAIGATALLSIRFEDHLRGAISEEAVAAATDRFWDQSPVRDALTAAAAGPVTAMHTATEGGVFGGLADLGRAAGVGVAIQRDRVPVQPGVAAACDFFGIDPWISSSEGTLLLSVDPSGVEHVLAALAAEGVPAADVGEVVAGAGLTVDGDDVAPPDHDPFWAALEEYAGTSDE